MAAVALGACVIEKHFTLDRSLPGPDHRASLEPSELTGMIQGICRVESALGSGIKKPAVSEANTASVARRSLTAAVDIPAGTTVTEKMICLRRPGTGLAPSRLSGLVGKKAATRIRAGTVLTVEMFE